MADFTPKFVDLVRNYTTTSGTQDFALGPAVNGFTGFAAACAVGERFYYACIGVDKPAEREIGRGTLLAGGKIQREPVGGAAKTNFTGGTKAIALVAAAEMYSEVQQRLSDGEASLATLQGDVSALSGSAARSAGTRAELAATIAAARALCILRESGREGLFGWDGSNLSVLVAADTQQGIYVAPASDPTGASGAWVRQFSGPMDIRWFGGVADALASGTGTDNAPALNGAVAVGAARSVGCEILFPKASGHYRFATTPAEFTVPVHIIGQGFSFNPGQVGGTTYAFPNNNIGTVLRFDADVRGLVFSDFTDNAPGATAFEYQSSRNSRMSNIMLLSMGGTGTTAHGADIFTAVEFRDVGFYGFAGNGLNIICNTAAGVRYGNANRSKFTRVLAQNNKLHGVYLEGNNANVINFDVCNFTGNGGCGTLDNSIVGVNSFVGCHYSVNNQSWDGAGLPAAYSAAQRAKIIADAPCLSDQYTGSAIQYRALNYAGTDIGNSSSYESCYVETGTGSKARLRTPTTIVGGFLTSTDFHHSEFTAEIVGANSLRNIGNFYHAGTANYTFNQGGLKVQYTSGTSIPKLDLTPFGATYSQIIMRGNSGNAALGLDIVAGGGFGQFSSDAFYYKNAAQSVTYATLNATSATWNFNTHTFKNSAGSATFGTLTASGMTVNDGNLTVTKATGNTTLTLTPTAGSYSNIIMKGANSTALGLDILAGGQAASLSSDSFYFRNAAQTVNYVSFALAGTLIKSGYFGYGTGAGGAVTQATSRTTGVTLNKACGQITLASAAGSTAWQTFTVTNSLVAATDTIHVSQASGTDLYMVHVTNVAAGSFKISFATTGGTTTEQPVFNFAVLKATSL